MKEWTIMVYMSGDNNLSVDMAYAMEQIKDVAGAEANGANLCVYYDGSSKTIPTLYCDFTDPEHPRHVRSFNVEDKLYRVEKSYNENAADYRSVLNFVDWCVNKVERRAQRYALIFSGHSLGFQDMGLFKDETSGKSMSLQKLSQVLDRVTVPKENLTENVHIIDANYEASQRRDVDETREERRTTELIGQKLDILGFDSCVMGMFEVGYEFRDVAETMIASEGSVPSAGWTYAKILGTLACEGKGWEVNKVAERFVTEFVKTQDAYTIGGVSVDMAAWDLSELPDLGTAFEWLSTGLQESFADPNRKIYKHMERVILQVHWKCQSYMYDQNVDIGDFCELLEQECDSLADELSGEDLLALQNVQKACGAVLDELRNAVIISGFSGGQYQYSNGMSLFFPWSNDSYVASQKNYESLDFVENEEAGKSWNEFLKRYVGEVTLRKFAKPSAGSVVPPLHSVVSDADVIAYSEPKRGVSKKRYISFAFEDENQLPRSNGSFAAAGDDAVKDPRNVATKDPRNVATKDPRNVATKDPRNVATKDPRNVATRDPRNVATKDPRNASTKMGGGGALNTLFSSFDNFKNIESHWNISGFTKKAEEHDNEVKSKKSSG